MESVPLTFGSLFAGIGGFDLGFERAGMVCKWQVEIDEYANRVLAKHWPGVHRERDIRQCGEHNLERVDVICGGFPCQDISYAGQGAGLDGERSGLFFEAVRVVRELRPRVVVLENVAALLTRGLDRVLGTLAEIGFDAEWHWLPAERLGAPHQRERCYVVAYAISERWQAGWIQDRKPCKAWPKTPMGERFRMVRTEDARQAITNIVRMDDGVPARVDRLRGLGNAVVPQVAEWIGRRIVESGGMNQQ
jgi:DNA (cytosine-5)-methyltransferase 1